MNKHIVVKGSIEKDKKIFNINILIFIFNLIKNVHFFYKPIYYQVFVGSIRYIVKKKKKCII